MALLPHQDKQNSTPKVPIKKDKQKTSVYCPLHILINMPQEYQLHEVFQKLILLLGAIHFYRLSPYPSTRQIYIHPLVHNTRVTFYQAYSLTDILNHLSLSPGNHQGIPPVLQ